MVKSNRIAIGVLLSMVMSTGSMALASDAISCRLELPDLICANSFKDGEAVLSAMAHKDSISTLLKAQFGPVVFADGDQREAFRISLERNRHSMRKFANKALRKHKRGRLPAEEYEAIRERYRKAMVTYREGLELYREGTWFHKD